MSLSAEPPENPLQQAFWANFWILAVALVFSFVSAALLLTVPMFILLIYDRVLPARSPETLVALMILSAGLIAIMGALDFARRRLLARLGARIQEKLEDRMVAHRTGVAGSEALDGLRSFFHSAAAVSLIDVLWAPLFILAVFVLHPSFGWTALIGLTMLTLVFVLSEIFSGYAREEAGRRREIVSTLKATAKRSGDVVAAHQMGPKVRQRWKEARTQSRIAAIRAKDRSTGFAALMRIVRIIFTVIILTVGASLVLEDQITTGALVATVVLLNRVFSPVLNLFRDFRAIGTARQNWQLVDTQVRAAPPVLRVAPRLEGDAPLVLDRVSVASDRRTTVLRNLSVSILPGELVEIAGPSGSGKTLLCQALLGLGPPRLGTVRIGDTPIAMIPPETMAGLFGYLPETIRFVEGTVFDAIAGSDSNPDPEAVMRAARAARVHDTIQALPGGYGFELDIFGSALSEGERTLIGLARALYLRPRFLVLDAPGSVISDAFGDELEGVMSELMSGGTAILLMHRQRQKLPAVTRRIRLEKGTLAESPRLQNVLSISPKPELVRSSS